MLESTTTTTTGATAVSAADLLLGLLAAVAVGYVVAGLTQQRGVADIVLSRDRATLLLAGSLPHYFKYKEALLQPVRNQLGCNSCWAFACCDAFADTLNLRSGGAWPHGPLSPQYLMSCTRVNYGCDVGGSPEDVYGAREVADVGVPLEKDMPYKSEVTACPVLPADAVRIRTEAGTGVDLCQNPSLALPGFRRKIIADNVLNMKKALLEYGPILGTLRITRELYDYKGDSIYTDHPESPTLGGHAIEIVGWSDAGANTAEPGFDDAYWVIRNSYSTAWGGPMYGYAYIQMGVNCADIESRASICRVRVPEFLQPAVQAHDIWTSAYTSYQEYNSDPDKQYFVDPERKRLLNDLHEQRRLAAQKSS